MVVQKTVAGSCASRTSSTGLFSQDVEVSSPHGTVLIFVAVGPTRRRGCGKARLGDRPGSRYPGKTGHRPAE
jgi:hypothetical protein